jgi:hypothetical protein
MGFKRKIRNCCAELQQQPFEDLQKPRMREIDGSSHRKIKFEK